LRALRTAWPRAAGVLTGRDILISCSGNYEDQPCAAQEKFPDR
jgi:hypothetical protein